MTILGRRLPATSDRNTPSLSHLRPGIPVPSMVPAAARSPAARLAANPSVLPAFRFERERKVRQRINQGNDRWRDSPFVGFQSPQTTTTTTTQSKTTRSKRNTRITTITTTLTPALRGCRCCWPRPWCWSAVPPSPSPPLIAATRGCMQGNDSAPESRLRINQIVPSVAGQRPADTESPPITPPLPSSKHTTAPVGCHGRRSRRAVCRLDRPQLTRCLVGLEPGQGGAQ